MIHRNQTNVPTTHPVERTTMNGSSDKLLHEPHRHRVVVDSRSVGSEEPLDLSRPLDLSKKSSKPFPPAAPQHFVSNGTPRHFQPGVQPINLHNNISGVNGANVPPLRSTKYPLQRGLAYVQPRKGSLSRNGGIPSEARLPDPPANKSSQHKVVGAGQQLMMNYAAMQQRVRTEAGNIAALQAQATNAAQEAVKQAMVRHAAASSAAKAKKEMPTAGMPPGVVIQRSHNPNSMFDAHRKRLNTGRMASVKPVQRKLTPSDIRELAMERQLAQLSAMHSEQDLLRAYRQMMSSPKASPAVFAKQTHIRPQTDNSSKTSATHKPSLQKPSLQKPLPGATDERTGRGYEAKHTHYSPQQQRIIDSHIAASKQNGFAAQVRAREQAMVKQQQELITRQQRQLIKEVNNNRRLQEFAKNERDRKAMVAEFNNKHLTSRGKMLEEEALARKHVGQAAIPALPSTDYLEAMAAYNAARTGQSQKRTIRSVSHTMSPPPTHGLSSPQCIKKPSPSVPPEVRSAVHSSSPHAEVIAASKVYPPIKRPSSSPHEEVVPRKIRSASSDTRSKNMFVNAIAEVQRNVVAQQMLYNTYKGMTNKKLSSVPVRERLLIARMSDRDRHDLMVAQMMEEQAMRSLKSNSRTGNKSVLSNIASSTEDEKIHAARTAHQNRTKSMEKPTSNHNVQGSSQNSLPKSVISPGPRENEESTADYLAQPNLIKQRSETAGQPPMKRTSRLPSYDDAIAAQRSLSSGETTEKVTPDMMSSVARQLVTSSKDWFKSYFSREIEHQGNDIPQQGKAENRIMTGDGHSLSKDKSAGKQVATSPVIESARQPKPEQKTLKESSEHDKETNSLPVNEVRKSSPTLPPTPPILDALGLGGRIPPGENSQKDPVVKSAIDVKRSFGKPFSDFYLTQSLGQSEVTPISPKPKPTRKVKTLSPEKPVEDLEKSIKVVEAKEQQKNSDAPTEASKGSEGSHEVNDLMQADTASLGSKERALQRAIIRFNVPERQISGGDQATEEIPVPVDTNKPMSRLKLVQRRRRRKLSKFRKRIRGQRTLTNVPVPQTGKKRGRPRRSSLPPTADMAALMRTKFQDFIPQVLERRTRNSGSGRVRNYRSMYDARNIRYELEIEKERAKVMERRRRLREFNSVDNASATETDDTIQDEDYAPQANRPHDEDWAPQLNRPQGVDYAPQVNRPHDEDYAPQVNRPQGEDYVPLVKRPHDEDHVPQVKRPQGEDYAPQVKRKRGRPRTKPRDENISKTPKQSTEPGEDATPEASPEKESAESPSKPLRVVLDQNTPNHIKIKFVNLHSMSTNEEHKEAEEGAPPQPRRRGRGRPRKSVGKCKSKTKNLGPPKSPEPPKLEIMSPCEDKENESDYEDFVQDPDYDVINPELTLPEYARVIRPDPPQEMKRFPLNKKLGETYLHRAASQGNMEIISYCIDYRVIDVNARDNAGYTALHDSCVEGHIDIAQHLLSHGADVNASAADGTRPIHDAVDNDRVQLVRLLLAYGADPFLATNTGRRVTKLALMKSSEMKTLLFGYLQDVNGDRSKFQDAPLHALDYQWSFNGSCSAFDTNTSSETYIFADVPGPDENKKTASGEEDEGVFFEISDKPILPSYNIRMENDDKFRNWLLLSDVTERLSLTKEELLDSNPDLEPVSLPACQFHQAAQESQITNSTRVGRGEDDVNVNPEVKGEEVNLLELNDNLRSVLGSEVKYVR